jgi:hypothetical protein
MIVMYDRYGRMIAMDDMDDHDSMIEVAWDY